MTDYIDEHGGELDEGAAKDVNPFSILTNK